MADVRVRDEGTLVMVGAFTEAGRRGFASTWRRSRGRCSAG
jgi:hypothetical protein